jgi:hypothetical protein
MVCSHLAPGPARDSKTACVQSPPECRCIEKPAVHGDHMRKQHSSSKQPSKQAEICTLLLLSLTGEKRGMW